MRFGEQLRVLREKAGLGLREAALAGGVPSASLSRYENDKAVPRPKSLRALGKLYGVDLISLHRQASENGDCKCDNDGVSWIPRMTVRASAGHGFEVIAEDVAHWVAFGTDWLVKKGINADNCAAIEVQGDSMEPELSDGCLVFIDRGNTAVTPKESLFLFRHMNDTYVKRLRMQPKVGIVVRSTNPQYESYVIDRDQIEDFEVLGRVFCSTRAFV